MVPVFRPAPEYLSSLFISVSRQSHQSYEVIVSDDGNSHDEIRASLPEELVHRVKYVNNSRAQGIFGNLNNAISHAKGEFVQVFCQDDIMLPSLLAENYKCLLVNPDADMVFSAFDLINNNGDVERFDCRNIRYVPKIIKPAHANDYFMYFGCMPGNLSPVMLRRRVFDKVGLFNETLSFAGDFEFWVRLAQHSRIVYCKEVNLLVRMHSGSASKSLGTIRRYKEIGFVYNFLLSNNSIPFSRHVLRRHIHIHLLRSISVYIIKRGFLLKSDEWKELVGTLNGRPYSIGLAIDAFFRPVTYRVRQLRNYMEQSCDALWE